MGTLTANSVRLPEHCEHKLPTSCRLTARPVCCACQDNRPHASSYSKYIDGVGFVPWGTRQERYCWPCKEFWDVRVSISGMRTAETRLPESPDLTDFLRQWYEWHRGYRVIKLEDDSEQRQALVGESLSDCAHGYLPRSVEELRSGMQPGDKERIERGGLPERPVAPVARLRDDDFVVPEDDRLFDEEDDPEEMDVGRTEPAAVSPIQAIRQAAAAEHGHLAELAGDMPSGMPERPSPPSSGPLGVSDSRLAAEPDLSRPLRIARQHYHRVAALRRDLQRLRINIERVTTDLQAVDIEVPDPTGALDHINRLNGHLARYQEAPLHIPEMNNPEWQSPITGMFERAWRWHHQVQSDRMQALHMTGPPVRDDRGRMAMPPPPPGRETDSDIPYEQLLSDWRSARRTHMALEAQQLLQAQQQRAEEEQRTSSLGLDEPGRPPAIEDDQAFRVDARCEVCLQQVANVATFPCGHMVMCQWCADEVVPRHVAARNVPRDPRSKCPQCRRKINHVYTVHLRMSSDYAKEEKAEGEERKGTEPTAR